MVISIDWAVAWLVAVGLTACVITARDKSCARRHIRRVPERTLWLVAVLGGAAPMWLTMLVVRHKTLHRRFMLGLPLLVAAQAVAVYALWYTEYLQFI